jgi:hypothetical protein
MSGPNPKPNDCTLALTAIKPARVSSIVNFAKSVWLAGIARANAAPNKILGTNNSHARSISGTIDSAIAAIAKAALIKVISDACHANLANCEATNPKETDMLAKIKPMNNPEAPKLTPARIGM